MLIARIICWFIFAFAIFVVFFVFSSALTTCLCGRDMLGDKHGGSGRNLLTDREDTRQERSYYPNGKNPASPPPSPPNGMATKDNNGNPLSPPPSPPDTDNGRRESLFMKSLAPSTRNLLKEAGVGQIGSGDYGQEVHLTCHSR